MFLIVASLASIMTVISKNQSRRSKMGLTIHLSDAYDAFYSSCFSFPLLLSLMTMSPTNQMMKVQGPGSLTVHTFLHVLNYQLIESFDCCLVESQNSLLVSVEYFQGLAFPAQKLL